MTRASGESEERESRKLKIRAKEDGRTRKRKTRTDNPLHTWRLGLCGHQMDLTSMSTGRKQGGPRLLEGRRARGAACFRFTSNVRAPNEQQVLGGLVYPVPLFFYF